MMNIITRRTALATGAAAITTGVVTAPLAMLAAGVKAALGGDPVIGLAQQLRTASDAWNAARDALEEDQHRVGYNWSYYCGLVSVKSSDGPCTWGASEIRAAAEDGRRYHRLTPEGRDAALAEIERRQREGEEVRQELGIEPQHQEVEHWKAQFWDLRERVLDMPATTINGILAKLRGFYHDDEIALIRAGDDLEEDLPAEWASSIYRDLESLAGEALT